MNDSEVKHIKVGGFEPKICKFCCKKIKAIWTKVKPSYILYYFVGIIFKVRFWPTHHTHYAHCAFHVHAFEHFSEFTPGNTVILDGLSIKTIKEFLSTKLIRTGSANVVNFERESLSNRSSISSHDIDDCQMIHVMCVIVMHQLCSPKFCQNCIGPPIVSYNSNIQSILVF